MRLLCPHAVGDVSKARFCCRCIAAIPCTTVLVLAPLFYFLHHLHFGCRDWLLLSLFHCCCFEPRTIFSFADLLLFWSQKVVITVIFLLLLFWSLHHCIISIAIFFLFSEVCCHCLCFIVVDLVLAPSRRFQRYFLGHGGWSLSLLFRCCFWNNRHHPCQIDVYVRRCV